MTLTAHRRARRSGALGATIALLLGALAFAAPAQAATGVNLFANNTRTSIETTLGDTVTLSWTSPDTATLTASGDWSGTKSAPSGSEIVTPTSTGTYTYTLTTGGDAAVPPADTVTVTVVDAVNTAITPKPVTFPNACTVIVPSTDHVSYSVEYGDGQPEGVDPNTYGGAEFYNDGDPVTFVATPNRGFTLSGATTFEYTPRADCPQLVSAKATCRAVTFTNLVRGKVDVLYGDANADKEDGSFTLKTGGSKTISTKRDLVFYVAYRGEVDSQLDQVDVPQNCTPANGGSGGASGHPTVAPDAGVSGAVGDSADGTGVPVSALIGLLGLLGLVAARSLRSTLR